MLSAMIYQKDRKSVKDVALGQSPEESEDTNIQVSHKMCIHPPALDCEHFYEMLISRKAH